MSGPAGFMGQQRSSSQRQWPAGAHFGRTRLSLRARIMQKMAPMCFCCGLVMLIFQLMTVGEVFKAGPVTHVLRESSVAKKFASQVSSTEKGTEAAASSILSDMSLGLPSWFSLGDGEEDGEDDDDEDQGELDSDAMEDSDTDVDAAAPDAVDHAATAGANDARADGAAPWAQLKARNGDGNDDAVDEGRSVAASTDDDDGVEDAEQGGLLGLADLSDLEAKLSPETPDSAGQDGHDYDLSPKDQAMWDATPHDSPDLEGDEGNLSFDEADEGLDSQQTKLSPTLDLAQQQEQQRRDAEASIARNETRYDGTHMVLAPQIKLPRKPIVLSYNSGQNFWPWYRVLKKRGWSHPTDPNYPESRASLLLSRGRVPRLKAGKQMLNSIGVSGCIGGAKLMQLACRRALAEHHGCSYEDLKIQPAQYNLDERASCEALYKAASRPENEDKLWLWKPSNTFHGKGIEVVRGYAALKARVGSCATKSSTAIIMEYVAEPATMLGGYKFDMRTYLLVGSLDPQLVFFADGFARKSDTVYNAQDKRANVHVTNKNTQSTKNHFFNFTQIADELSREMKFPPDYMDRAREYMKKVSLYVFKTTDVQNQKLSRFPGRFHLFALDWLLDKDGQVHLLEGNGYPLVTNYPIEGLTPAIWEEAIDLVLKIHVTPHELPTSLTHKDGFTHGKWSLIYNELEEKYHGDPFSPCYMFPEPSLLEDKSRRTQRRT